MKDNGSYIKLYRKITDWEWYTDTPTKVLFIHILLRASATGRKYRGQDIPVGSFTTSVGLLASETGLSNKQVRTALKNLETTKEITRQTTNKFTQIFVIKWGDYQSFIDVEGKQNGNQKANEGQTKGKQRATIKESKESKECIESNNNKPGGLIPYDEIIEYLNSVTGRKYKASQKAKQCIKARLEEKYTFEDFKQVINNMSAKWLNNPEMNRFLRPETLFSSKMNGYLNETMIEEKEKKSEPIETYEMNVWNV